MCAAFQIIGAILGTILVSGFGVFFSISAAEYLARRSYLKDRMQADKQTPLDKYHMKLHPLRDYSDDEMYHLFRKHDE